MTQGPNLAIALTLVATVPCKACQSRTTSRGFLIKAESPKSVLFFPLHRMVFSGKTVLIGKTVLLEGLNFSHQATLIMEHFLQPLRERLERLVPNLFMLDDVFVEVVAEVLAVLCHRTVMKVVFAIEPVKHMRATRSRHFLVEVGCVTCPSTRTRPAMWHHLMQAETEAPQLFAWMELYTGLDAMQ